MSLHNNAYSIRSGRTGENKEIIDSEYDRIFNKPSVRVHGGNEDIESFQERTTKALIRQNQERSGK